MAKQTSSKASPSAAKGKTTSEAQAPVTSVVDKIKGAAQEVVKDVSAAVGHAGDMVPTEPSMLTVKPAPTHAEIAKRAHELSQEQGHGSDLDHWLAAEKDLLSK